jgi:hypothetical protein
VIFSISFRKLASKSSEIQWGQGIEPTFDSRTLFHGPDVIDANAFATQSTQKDSLSKPASSDEFLFNHATHSESVCRAFSKYKPSS